MEDLKLTFEEKKELLELLDKEWLTCYDMCENEHITKIQKIFKQKRMKMLESLKTKVSVII